MVATEGSHSMSITEINWRDCHYNGRGVSVLGITIITNVSVVITCGVLSYLIEISIIEYLIKVSSLI